MSVSQIKAGSDTHDIVAAGIVYAECDTAEDTAAKVATVVSGNFRLFTGARVIVKFTEKNAIASPTLNVAGTGAYAMCRYGTTAMSTGTTTSGWIAGAIQAFTFDGTSWVQDYWNNTTYSNVSLGHGYATCTTAADTVAKVATLSSYKLATGGIVAVRFSYDVPASATLNVNSTGAKAIYYRNAKITAGVIKAGDIATFVYSSYYRLIAVDRDADVTHPTTTAYTSGNTTTTISGSGGSGTIKIPQITVDANGHVTAAADESVTITMPTVPTVDTALSDTSTNPVQNKVVYTALSGKAGSSHSHAAGDITSGTLGVARGGTGKATHTSNAVLTGNGTSAVNNVATASGALYATAANGAAKFGTLPIAQGGTGATTAAAALTALGAAASSHNHAASAITSGTLPVARGGTGQTSVDTSPTSGSAKMVTSGGVYTALSGKQAKITSVSATLAVASWTEQSDGSYAQTVTVSGVTTSNNVMVDCALTGSDIDADIAVLEGWGCVNRATQAANSMTFYCYGDVPTVAIPITAVIA